ncbi:MULTISPECIES: hypothetical protein [unclassified Exiguobacterium]|uniref:hypothetical protein n=1 Tax=unclassified Exiguobacterium TaxID=2644629 RepID=UPI001BE8F86E|nr:MULTISPECIES: hypothetical protein [unclassified Exiguobacterium]
MLNIILWTLILMFIMSIVIVYSSIGYMGVDSGRRKAIYTLLGTIYAFKLTFNFRKRYEMIANHFKKHDKELPSKVKLALMVFFDTFDVKNNIEAIAISSAAFERRHPSRNSETTKEEFKEIKETIDKNFKNTISR